MGNFFYRGPFDISAYNDKVFLGDEFFLLDSKPNC